MRLFRWTDPGFAADFAAYAIEPRGAPAETDAFAAEVIAAVRAEGLAAVIRYGERFDRGFDARNLALDAAAIAAGALACPKAVRAALALAAERIRAYHERQRPADARFVDETGTELGWRWRPLAAVGLYVPGGRAAYPSSVLMNAIPARVAGVARVAMATPPGRLEPAVLAAAELAGVSEIWRVGGAHAIAALALGAGPIAPVDKIVGPGNAFVTAAKRRLFGLVGIDSLAGPSEIVVVAEPGVDPAWIAADLMSQAEHDPDARAVLITPDEAFGRTVAAAVEKALATLPTAETAAASWRAHGAVVVAPLDQTPALVDALAPEHVELALGDPAPLAEAIRHAGAIFLGRMTPEAIGDYVAGSNHVLPTSGAARFASGLSVLDFVKRTSLIRCDEGAFAALGGAARTLAVAEGLPAHARSIEVRLAR